MTPTANNLAESEPQDTMDRESTGWRAFHLFVAPSEPVEALLVDIVEDIRALAPPGGSWFFIRYLEGGYHLRIRVRDFPLSDFGALVTRTRERAAARLGRAVRVALVAYEPEVQRYGGPAAIAENEALFERSSELALRIIAASQAQPPRRINLAVELMLAVPAALNLDAAGAARFFDGYAASWLTIFGVDAAALGETDLVLSSGTVALRLAGLADGAAAPATPGTVWKAALGRSIARFGDIAEQGALVSPFTGERVKDAADLRIAVGSMLTSQLHMLNNRLGLSPNQEYHLARNLANALRNVSSEA
jgi:hypothetical protein